MTTFHQTLELMAQSWLDRTLRDIFFGRPKKGDPIYDTEPTVHSTYPKEWRPGSTDEYNDWIRSVHEKRPHRKK